MAAHAARAGVPSIVFIPADLEPGKVVTTAVYGGDVVAIDGSYDDVNRLCSELTETDEFEQTAFVNVNLRPFYAEGLQDPRVRGGRAAGLAHPGPGGHPDGLGELLTKVDKAFTELVEIGLAEAPAGGWRVFGAQSAGCNPIAAALRDGTDEITPVKPTGIAKSLNIGDPAAGVVTRWRRCAAPAAGWTDADDDEIRDGIRLLAATTGVFAETAGGVTVAVLAKLVAEGKLDPALGDGRLQHRRGPQDPGRGGGPGGTDISHRAVAASRPGCGTSFLDFRSRRHRR